MGRNLFLCTLTLIAGICIGILCAFSFLDPVPPLQSADTAVSAPIASVSPQDSHSPSSQHPLMSTATPVPDTDDNRALLSVAFDVVFSLKNKDFHTLSSYVHPVDGVVFTPYSTVDLNANVRFTPAEVSRLDDNDTKYVWGISDGKGEALEMTVSEYFARYVYNADYLQAPMLGVDQIIGSGNALENVREAFPAARFVEFYFPGIVPEYNGFDWCGLKLVFTEYKGEYKLSAIIHSEWTI